MLKGLYTSYTGMINEQHRMDVLANNLANVDTTGFKKEGTVSQEFADILAYKIKDTSEAGNLPKRMGVMNMGVKIGENYTDYSEGGFKQTNNIFDVAIGGNGFFTIEFTNKADEVFTKYTRDGNFTLDQQGNLVTQDGDFVLNKQGRHIRLDPLAQTQITQDGGIYQDGALVDTIYVADFEDYNYLQRYGENYFETVDGATVRDAENFTVNSGYLEMSNISVVSEMVNMIAIQRQYEANQKLITTYDSSLDIAVNQLGKV